MTADIHSIVQEAVGQLGGSKKAVENHVGYTDALVRALQKRLAGADDLKGDDFKEAAIQVFNKTVLAQNPEMTVREAHKGYANLFAEGFAKLAVKAAAAKE